MHAANAAGPTTDIANEPLVNSGGITAKPNLMFILDNSGSMGSAYMPDDMSSTSAYGYYSAQCNGVAFDPNNAYPPPVYADGTSYPNIDITKAPSDGYTSTTGSTNLTTNTSYNYYYQYSGAQKALNWTYKIQSNGSAKVDSTTTFYTECTTSTSKASSVFTKVLVSSLNATQKQAYANWYAYYHTRILMMRTALGLAMKDIDDSYRVGFTTINTPGSTSANTSVTPGMGFRDVKDFGPAQKTDFYTSLYGVAANGNTPLRTALSRVGRYYANKASTSQYDPMQYSCQRNYALLTTDGYWNTGTGYKLDGSSAVGNQDGVLNTTTTPRPVFDGTGENGSKGSSDTLSDVAQYYWVTDLRTPALNNCTSGSSGVDVCSNDTLKPLPTNPATWQHMSTFSIGLGVNGTLPFDPNYLAQTSGAYVDLKNGTINWPVPPTAGGDATTIDDLWHTAVNGRGQYYSALNAASLSNAINDALTKVAATSGAGSAAGTNTLALTSGDSQVYKASYMTQAWTGDVQAFSFNPDDGTIGTTPLWSAQAKIDTLPQTNRKILFRDGTGALSSFTYANLSTTQKGYFDNLCGKPSPVPTQCNKLSSTELAVANSGAELVNYLRGDRTREAPSTDSSGNSLGALFRPRDHILGDIIGGAPVYIGSPPFIYNDSGYASFANSNTNRKPMLYTAANDGMLHAISADSADGGTELWAYVPGQVMANMYRLSDTDYASRHLYFVDGAPVMGDIQVGGVWKTILVGGFNAGGPGYYALDITDPANPKSLWEFNDANMGQSFGNPMITKRADGTWVVAFTSGYNAGGDGQGHLYVVDAYNGTKKLDISTGAGTGGLAQINAWVDDPADNTALRFYGGDVLGNLWRFDIDNLVQPYQAALKLAQFQVGGTPQPVTIRPQLIEPQKGTAVVVIATGRYLGVSDISDTTQQSIYAVKDPLTNTSWGIARNNAAFVQQSFTLSGTNATLTSNTVDWSTAGGWYVDLPHTSERVATNMGLLNDMLVVASAIPSNEACVLGGSSWLYYLNVSSGGSYVQNDQPTGGLYDPNAMIVGQSWVKVKNSIKLIIQDSGGGLKPIGPDEGLPQTGGGSGTPRRVSWRELIN